MIRKWVACGLLLALVGFVGFTAGCGGNTATTTTTTLSTTTTTIATVSITGTVKFATTNDGVKGNTYISYTGEASGAIVASSTTGTYEISALSIGTYYLTVTKEGWTASAETVALTAAATQDLSITPSSWEVHFIGSTNLNRSSLISDGNRRNYLIVGDSGKAYGLSLTATSPLGIDWSGVKTIATDSTTDNYVGIGYAPQWASFLTVTGANLGLTHVVTIETWDDWSNGSVKSIPGGAQQPDDLNITNITSGLYGVYAGNVIIQYLVAGGTLEYRNDTSIPDIWHIMGGGSLSLRDVCIFTSALGGDDKLYLCGANGKLAATTATSESDPAANSVVEISGFPTTEQLNSISAGSYSVIVTEQGNIYSTATPSTGSSWTTDPSSSASGTRGLSGIPYALNAVQVTDFGTYVVGDNGLLMIHTN